MHFFHMLQTLKLDINYWKMKRNKVWYTGIDSGTVVCKEAIQIIRDTSFEHFSDPLPHPPPPSVTLYFFKWLLLIQCPLLKIRSLWVNTKVIIITE